MWRKRFIALVLLLAGAGLGYGIYYGENHPQSAFGKFPFKYGLDIQGGTQLTYQADTSKSIEQHLENLWKTLTREPAHAKGS